jgi:hypothetical protein
MPEKTGQALQNLRALAIMMAVGFQRGVTPWGAFARDLRSKLRKNRRSWRLALLPKNPSGWPLS